jgi:predicted O-methyltransferase YrrM
VSAKTLGLPDDLNAYVVANGSTPDDLVRDLIEETRASLPDRFDMQVAPEQAAFLTMLTKIQQARLAVEVGTFTGLSSICIARGLVPGGRLICCDVSAEFTSIARRYWKRAGLEDRIELRLGPAVETLAALPAEPHLDLAFIDADKTGYAAYWEAIVPRLVPGGLVLVDNVLRSGHVLDRRPDVSTQAIIDFNAMVLADERVESVLLPIADGVTLARRV